MIIKGGDKEVQDPVEIDEGQLLCSFVVIHYVIILYRLVFKIPWQIKDDITYKDMDNVEGPKVI